ncbi:MAG: hypothetical protein JW719_11340 [Pirellulales bacterium]|nr:hypothetical protein [Pirellulales bacterium]
MARSLCLISTASASIAGAGQGGVEKGIPPQWISKHVFKKGLSSDYNNRYSGDAGRNREAKTQMRQ